MTTAQQVFETAMSLMDELSEATGQADTTDTKEYKQRTLSVLNVLQGELYPYSDTYTLVQAGKRPICTPVTSLALPIDLDDVLCQTVMPYGLAAHLLLDENPAAASFFFQRYGELLAQLGKGIPAEFEPITDVYGGIGHSEYGRW